MKNRKQMIMALIIVLLMIAGPLWGCGVTGEGSGTETYTELAVGDAAPDFTVEQTDGNSFTLSEHEGEVILLNFWATWCGPCVREMPAFERLCADYGDEIRLIAVNCAEDRNTVDRFLDDEGFTFPIGYDENGDVNEKYPKEGIPYTLIIGRDGKIAEIYVGAWDADRQYALYKDSLEKILQE